MSDRRHGLSVDVEEGFHSATFSARYPVERWPALPVRVIDQTVRLLDLLERHGARATFFVLGWVAETQPALVRRIAAAGNEIASHGYAHRLAYELGPHAFREDLVRSKRVIEDALGEAIVGHRAANFSITERSLWALDILGELGFRYDSSVYPVRHHRYGIPDSPLAAHRRGAVTELPIATLDIGPLRVGVGGGAYMRFLPRRLWLAGLASVARRRPLMLYVHPWETDPDQPHLRGPVLAQLRQYGGQGGAVAKLGAAFERFAFVPYRELAGGAE